MGDFYLKQTQILLKFPYVTLPLYFTILSVICSFSVLLCCFIYLIMRIVMSEIIQIELN